MEIATLIAQAKAVRTKAYVPYSHFAVGAVVWTDTGQVFAGCNVENASYGLTICAERNAIFQAVSQGHQRLAGLLLIGPTSQLLMPCGACRQVMSEFMQPTAKIHCVYGTDLIKTYTMAEILPNSFNKENLNFD
ncbi:hypothetical protein FC83_GL002845 [Agrilactobacillus composti DSM 18527 = JCM 14202]|uniref:Cytidine deaminase n=1 Tax=Agrilactobacillus composti DSM 18527 = JCM 14202 TaxID=1423734 RepID=X0PG28_9LACO|nr:cytidine deaminase [Agrilactobacillus composti]KRM33454.1 hypothetical protein FC83_GL002845 [Agrilactobacillus composti DSM 18527 = JCM 14202]GAF40793.1 cytidine deaminase [Agrilactobacillus composti DSM 18527 = JCM 14202]